MPLHAIEVTDTFGGEPNYAWVRRGTTTRTSRRGLIAAAKTLAGWDGRCRVRVTEYDDFLELRPTDSSGIYQVAFVTFADGE